MAVQSSAIERERGAQVRRWIPTRRWIPNQHGAWAMLASPLLVGIVAAGPSGVDLPLTIMWFLGYSAFFAAGLWLKSGRKPRYTAPMVVQSITAAMVGLVVLAMEPRLLRWLPLFVLPLGVGLWLSSQRKDRALVSGLATTFGAAGITLVAYDAGGGQNWTRAWWLAALQAIYFAGTVFVVKSVIRERGNPVFARWAVGYHIAAWAILVIVMASGWAAVTPARQWYPAILVLFGVLTVRAAILPRWRPHPSPALIGIGEAVATVAVAVTSLLAVR